MRRVATALAWLATLLYPLAIWLGLARFEPRWLALVLLVVAGLRAIGSPEPVWRFAAAGALVLVIATLIALASSRSRTAMWLLFPYLAWVSFATMLNTAIVQLN